MINKNKEEIEKIKKEMNHMFDSGIDYKYVRQLVIQLDERIKTSILWCKDEIELIESVIDGIVLDDNIEIDINEINLKLKISLKNKISQLQTHLKWLKEQEQTK